MGVVTFTDEFASPVSPARIFKALVLDAHNLFPKILPEAIKSVDIKGDGGAGTIKKINLAGGFAKYRVDELDEKTFTYNSTLIEGEGISDKVEKVSYEIKYEASAAGGTITKVKTTIYTHGDFEIKEEELNAGKEQAFGIYKVVEAYLVNNPEAYA